MIQKQENVNISGCKYNNSMLESPPKTQIQPNLVFKGKCNYEYGFARRAHPA
jgi:hypothetical protein